MASASDAKYQPTDAEIAWAAGLFDGEGHVGIHWCRGMVRGKVCEHLQLLTSVANTHIGCLEKFQSIVGVGKIHVSDTRNRNKPLYVWRTQAKKSDAVLRMLLPYLVVKREQADLAIEFRTTFPERRATAKGHPLSEEVKAVRVDLAHRVKALKIAS